MQYFVRYKFILGLSRYDEDDTISEREEEAKVVGKEYINYSVLDLITQKTKFERKKKDELPDDDCVIHMIGEISSYLKETDILDRVVDEHLLNTYMHIDEQEFQVCKWMIWTIYDIGIADYVEVVGRILLYCVHEDQCKIFSSIKEVEETIKRLVYRGILSQYMEYISYLDENGNRRRIRNEPSIYLVFKKEPIEAFNAINETFGRVIKSYFVQHNCDTLAA
jgi:hypothetical protein